MQSIRYRAKVPATDCRTTLSISFARRRMQLLALVAVALSANVMVGPSVRWRPFFVSGILGAMVACEVSLVPSTPCCFASLVSRNKSKNSRKTPKRNYAAQTRHAFFIPDVCLTQGEKIGGTLCPRNPFYFKELDLQQ